MRGHRYRQLIHQLNQRYRREFDRAERLRAELEDVYRSRAWRFVAWLRRMKRALTGPIRAAGADTPLVFGTRVAHPRKVPDCRVSLVIPFRDQPRLLKGCLASLQRSTFHRLEVVLVDNGSQEIRTYRLLSKLAGKRGWQIVRVAEPFNFSRLCNRGAKLAAGEYLVFLNNDTEIITPNWLEQMLAVAQRRDVGVVGATLLYPDRTIQHAGIAPQGGAWVHLYRGRHYDDRGDHGELRHVRAVPAVTGACLLIRRSLFFELGGFDERLPVVGNDVDLCRRVRERGLIVAVTPHARLIHFECLTRGYSADSYCA
jgi:GT2 family glycosyltransferase